MFNKKIKQMKKNRFKTFKTFKNYASENCLYFWDCNEEDVKRAWRFYSSKESKNNDYSVNYCISSSLEVKQLIF